MEELGTYQIALAIALLLQPLATLRVDFVLPGITDDLLAARLMRRGQGAGLLLLAILVSSGGFCVLIGEARVAEILFLTGPLAVAYSWLALDGGRFIRTQEVRALAVRNLVSGLAAAVLQCAVALIAPTAVALAAAIIAARLLAVGLSRAQVLSPILVPRSCGPPLIDAAPKPYPPRRVATAVAGSLLDTSILQSLVVVPGVLLGAQAAGYTGMTQRITTSPASLVVGGVGQVAQVRVSAAMKSDGRTFEALKPMLLRLAAIAAVLGLAVALIAPFLVVPILGPAWEPLERLLPITAPALGMQVVSLTLVPVGMMLGAETSLLILNTVRLAAIVGGTVLTAFATGDLTYTVIWWSASTTIGYCCQLLLIVGKARRFSKPLVTT